MASARAFKFDLTESFPNLPSAPIVEAVIHWTARAGKELQPQELKRHLCERLTDYQDCQPVGLLQVEQEFHADGSARESRQANGHGFRLTSSDKMYIVQFNRDGLVFSRLQPYLDWDSFSAEGLRLWVIFVDLFQPSEVERLGVRFINRISPIVVAKVGRYLENPPECLEPLGLPMEGFFYQSTHDVPKRPFQIKIAQTIQPSLPPQNEPGLIFDIDVSTKQAFPCEDEILKDHLAKMRWLKNKAFFSLMTKHAIKLFKRAKP